VPAGGDADDLDGFPSPTVLCGSMFGLEVRRHRLFWSSEVIPQPECRHHEQERVLGVYGNGGADRNRAARGGGGGIKVAGAEAARALGINWSHRQSGLSQAIPPAYTEWLGWWILRDGLGYGGDE
jgi:DNA (cytosine-5)-methyltransferase 1